jgi:hypothetical protein
LRQAGLLEKSVVVFLRVFWLKIKNRTQEKNQESFFESTPEALPPAKIFQPKLIHNLP